MTVPPSSGLRSNSWTYQGCRRQLEKGLLWLRTMSWAQQLSNVSWSRKINPQGSLKSQKKGVSHQPRVMSSRGDFQTGKQKNGTQGCLYPTLSAWSLTQKEELLLTKILFWWHYERGREKGRKRTHFYHSHLCHSKFMNCLLSTSQVVLLASPCSTAYDNLLPGLYPTTR